MNRKREIYDKINSGLRIQESRTALHMTQEELAKKVDRAAKYVSDIERGKCGMSLDTAISFSEALGVSVDYILFGKISLEQTSEAPKASEKKEFSSLQDVYHFYFNASPEARKAFLDFATAFSENFPSI